MGGGGRREGEWTSGEWRAREGRKEMSTRNSRDEGNRMNRGMKNGEYRRKEKQEGRGMKDAST